MLTYTTDAKLVSFDYLGRIICAKKGDITTKLFKLAKKQSPHLLRNFVITYTEKGEEVTQVKFELGYEGALINQFNELLES